ncbi:helix-turn-helix domain-containing protein [Arthrobacter sp. S2(2024)]|uniref:helix-turn-helix domain-containing protein n=1 Tax=Arthrobacter sp. S2(2024) TaxID=3111911 RepID=UPI003FA52C50
MTDVSSQSHAGTGTRIREIRRLRGLSLRELARLSGTTASFISQFERGESGASLATLVKLTRALGMSLPQFFEGDSPEGHVTRSHEHPELHLEPGHSKLLLTTPMHRTMEAYRSTLDPGHSTGDAPYTHGDSDEIVFILSGQLLMDLGEDTYVLGTGDTVEFRSSVPHRLRNESEAVGSALIFVSPPSMDADPQAKK